LPKLKSELENYLDNIDRSLTSQLDKDITTPFEPSLKLQEMQKVEKYYNSLITWNKQFEYAIEESKSLVKRTLNSPKKSNILPKVSSQYTNSVLDEIRPKSRQKTRLWVGLIGTLSLILLIIFAIPTRKLMLELALKSQIIRNMNGQDLSGADLRGIKLDNVNFSKANLSGVNFEGASLTNAIFIKANLEQSNLSNANLNGARLIEAKSLFEKESSRKL
jgi:uncharacterized protein YjbI with pentapeptide repeats